MENDTLSQAAREAILAEVMQGIQEVVEQMLDAVSRQGELRTVEQQVVSSTQAIGNLLLGSVCNGLAASYPAREVACGCGGVARYTRMRTVQTTTLLDTITVRRAYYVCEECHQGQAPLDEQLGFCAGGVSAGLAEVMALLGVTQDSFEQATAVLAKLSLVTLCPNSVRHVTETVGTLALADEQAQVEQAWQGELPPVRTAVAERLYLSLDGTMVNVRREGWKEARVGAVYTTVTRPSRKRPGTLDIHATDASFVADLTNAASFGRQVWCEAMQRGVEQAQEVIVVGDGAEWIWNLADEHFPQATQIVDWYHASQYVWQAAYAIHGESELATRWAQRALDKLWEGDLRTLCANLKKYHERAPVRKALTYFLNNQARMHYDQYRARGLQIGSGTIESACKHVIAQRLKLAGMRWNRPEARAMLALRARLKSGQWDETFAHFTPQRRRLATLAA